MTPEERANLDRIRNEYYLDDLILNEDIDWMISELDHYLCAAETEAAAELRGKRAAFEEMAAWCEINSRPYCACVGELQRRARELGHEVCKK